MKIHGTVTLNRPSAQSDGSSAEVRFSGSRDLIVSNALSLTQLALDGRLIQCMTPTPASGQGISTAGAYSATSAVLTVRNVGANYIMPVRIGLVCTSAGGGTAGTQYMACIRANTDWVSGGVVCTTASRRATGGASSIQASFGGLTVVTQPNPTVISRGTFKPFQPIVGDQYILRYGDLESGVQHQIAGTSVQTTVVCDAPFLIPPNYMYVLHMWGPNSTPPGYELSAIFAEILC